MALLLIVLIIGAAVVLEFIDFNQYKPLIAEEVRKATGRDLAIAGDLTARISFAPGIAVDGVTMSNAGWGSRPDMVSARRLEAHVALIPLIFGDLEIKCIKLAGADILLETDSLGRANFEFEPPEAGREDRQPAAAGSGIVAVPVIHGVEVRDSRLTYISGATGATYSIDVESLTLASGGWGEPIDVVYAGSFHDAPITARAELGAVVDLLEPRNPWPVELTLEAGGGVVTVSGTIAEPLTAVGLDLAIEASGKQLGDLSKLAGAEVPALGVYSFSTRVLGDAAAVIALPDLKAVLGESDLSGEGTVTLTGASPVAEARLNSGKIDLAALGAGLEAPLLNASAIVSLQGGKLDIESLSATLSGAAVTAKGSIEAPARGEGLNLAVSAQGGQLGDLSQLTGAKVPALGAYSMSARVTGDARSTIGLAGLQARTGAGQFTGEATVTPGVGGTVFAANLASKQIDLRLSPEPRSP
jgi:uncharacterized protein involved in outer membrane biogenesis